MIADMTFLFQQGGIYSLIEIFLGFQFHVWINTFDLLSIIFRQYIFQNNLELDKRKCRFKNNYKNNNNISGMYSVLSTL